MLAVFIFYRSVGDRFGLSKSTVCRFSAPSWSSCFDPEPKLRVVADGEKGTAYYIRLRGESRLPWSPGSNRRKSYRLQGASGQGCPVVHQPTWIAIGAPSSYLRPRGQVPSLQRRRSRVRARRTHVQAVRATDDLDCGQVPLRQPPARRWRVPAATKPPCPLQEQRPAN
ncbi:hypothetical protein ISCGN_013632 [Ixodes scapularis]